MGGIFEFIFTQLLPPFVYVGVGIAILAVAIVVVVRYPRRRS